MYFIRIDDLQPGMNKSILTNIISFFKEINIKPLLAVIPYWKEDTAFWNTLKGLQKQWWIIWLHWYNHKLRQNPKNTKSLIPIQNYSEFVGLPYKEQNKKIQNGIRIFNKYWIKTNIFVAPAHWLDEITLKTLKENNIKFVSDWFFLYPKIINWIIFLPQQLWTFRKLPIWYKTICLHLKDFTDLNNYKLRKLKENKTYLRDFSQLLTLPSEQNAIQKIINHLFEKFWFTLLKLKRIKW